MSIWCNACQCHVTTPCTSHHLSKDQRPSSFHKRFRSTKGASKARRDHINNEIRNMRTLLPITPEDQERLSYLHSMAVICTYIRKSVLFEGLTSKEEYQSPVPYEAFLQALHGFILVITAQGRLVYVSENVMEYLGISTVDVLQGDSLYDMLERSDIDVVKSNLDFDGNTSERSFVCVMQTSKPFKLQNGGSCSMLIRGSFQFFPLSCDAASASSSSSTCPVTEPLFVALCTPTANRLRPKDAQFYQTFSSIHRLDMSFSHVSDSVVFYLGFSSEEITSRSWYSLVHPEDLPHCAESHKTLVQENDDFQLQMVLRLQGRDLSWSWVYVRANKTPQSISCTNFIISETEARFLRQKIDSEALGPADSCHSSAQQPTNHQPSKCLKRQRTSGSQSEEPCARKGKSDSGQERVFEVRRFFAPDDCSPSCDSPAMFTPPYTPSSCTSSLGHELLMDVLSSPEASPSYFTYPTATLTCGQSPSQPQSPVTLPPLQQFEPSSLGSFTNLSSLPSSPSPSYDDFAACTPNARLVPDCLSASCESPTEECTLHQEDLSLLEQPQGGSVVHHVPEHALLMLTPSQSPASLETFEYSERERQEISILAQQISSLASSFDTFRTLRPLQNTQSSTMNARASPFCFPLSSGFKTEPVLDECIFDSIFSDLELVTRKSGSRNSGRQEQRPLGLSPEVSEPADVRTDMDQNNGLHQLDRYIHSGLQRDGLAEENLY